MIEIIPSDLPTEENGYFEVKYLKNTSPFHRQLQLYFLLVQRFLKNQGRPYTSKDLLELWQPGDLITILENIAIAMYLGMPIN